MTVERIKQRMMDSLPNYYNESPEANAIMHGNAVELQKRREEADDLLNQFFVLSATWGLADWERVLALPPMPRESLEYRRQRILAKLNGTAPVTIQYLTDLLNVYTQNKDAEIKEYNAEYRFEAFVGADNIVKSEDIYNAVNEIKPAHLAFMLAVREIISLKLTGRTYFFDVPYKITNLFRTDDVKGGLMRVPLVWHGRAYQFPVRYPITNMFRTATRADIKSGVGVSVMASRSHVFYMRAGMTTTSEERSNLLTVDNGLMNEGVSVVSHTNSITVTYPQAGATVAGEEL